MIASDPAPGSDRPAHRPRRRAAAPSRRPGPGLAARLDPGWTFVLAGLAVLAAWVLVPAAADRDALADQLQDLEDRHAILLERTAAHRKAVRELAAPDVELVRRLSVATLRRLPAGQVPVLVDGGDRRPLVDRIVPPPDPALLLAEASDTSGSAGGAERSGDAGAPSRLERLVTGPTRLWVAAGAIFSLFIGLMLAPSAVTAEPRRPPAWRASSSTSRSLPRRRAARPEDQASRPPWANGPGTTATTLAAPAVTAPVPEEDDGSPVAGALPARVPDRTPRSIGRLSAPGDHDAFDPHEASPDDAPAAEPACGAATMDPPTEDSMTRVLEEPSGAALDEAPDPSEPTDIADGAIDVLVDSGMPARDESAMPIAYDDEEDEDEDDDGFWFEDDDEEELDDDEEELDDEDEDEADDELDDDDEEDELDEDEDEDELDDDEDEEPEDDDEEWEYEYVAEDADADAEDDGDGDEETDEDDGLEDEEEWEYEYVDVEDDVEDGDEDGEEWEEDEAGEDDDEDERR